MNELNEISIRALVENVMQQLRQIGLSEATMAFYRNESLKLIIRFFEEREVLLYSSDVINEYLAFEQSRFKKGEIGAKRLRALELGAKRLMCVADDGKLEWWAKNEGHKLLFRKRIKTYWINTYPPFIKLSQQYMGKRP